MIKKLILIVPFLLLFSTSAWAGAITVKWDTSPESDIGGYKLYYWEEASSQVVEIDVGDVTTFTIIGLITGKHYIIYATAYDTSGNESERSNHGVRGKAKYSKVAGLRIEG